MRTYRYLHLDVFTEHPFEGNQLAVFPEPAGLTDAEMATLTKEMNFSESTFIFAAEEAGTGVRMRIFTPAEELPIAGHPTIGSTFALVHEGTIAAGTKAFVFGLNAGPTPVSLDWKGNTLGFAWMTQKNPGFEGRITDRAAFASAIGLGQNDLLGDHPIEIVSTGVPFLFAALRSRAAVDRISIDRRAYTAACVAAGIKDLPLFAFTTDRIGAHGDEAVYSRMLAPHLGISEDPATGIASGALGSYLATYGLIDDAALTHHVSLQGAAMGRPSRIHISIERDGKTITRVRVGGTSVLVGKGELYL